MSSSRNMNMMMAQFAILSIPFRLHASIQEHIRNKLNDNIEGLNANTEETGAEEQIETCCNNLSEVNKKIQEDIYRNERETKMTKQKKYDGRM